MSDVSVAESSSPALWLSSSILVSCDSEEVEPIDDEATTPMVDQPLGEASPAEDGRALSGSVVADSYRVLRPIGRGAMGCVYEVEHARTGRRLAMKVLTREMAAHPEVARRFIREAKAISRLDSDNTVQVFDHGVSNGLGYIVMELLRGQTLGASLLHDGPFGQRRALRVALGVCHALVEAHDKGIIHRDIKPDNLMLIESDGGSERVKVLDFGLAKILAPDSNDVVSSAGMVMGTPHYMSPEQILGNVVDARSDVYALGALLYRMMTGRRPFGGSMTQVMAGHMTVPPILPELRAPDAGISPDASAIVMQCMAKNPEDRFQSARALGNALELVLERLDALPATAPPMAAPPLVLVIAEDPETEPSITGYERALSRRTRGHWLVFMAAFAVAALGAWAIYAMRAR